MTVSEPHPTATRAAPRTHWWLVLLAGGFLLWFVSTSVVVPAVASGPLPLPNAPAEQARSWFAGNQLAAVLTGVLQLLSVACLGGFAVGLRRTAVTSGQAVAARRALWWALLAVAGMALSSLLGWILAAVAADASVGTVDGLRTANFVAGGAAHVAALGVFVLLAARIPGYGPAVRRFAVVAAVPAVLSVVSLLWFPASILILLGRLLCMIWTISAAVSVTRRGRARPGQVSTSPDW